MSKTRTITPNPPADFMPEHQNIRPFRAWCQKVLPLVYDDSLGYYELLCKVLDTLNKTVIEVINLGGAYDKLEEYVNNYFKNLDIQEEINNKLDQMVEDGTLESIISKYITQNIIRRYLTVSDMLADDGLMPGMCAITLGYYSIDDLGGASYTVIEDRETDFDLQSVNGFCKIIRKDTMTPEMFGAKGDGVADDSNAIQTCVNYGGIFIFNKNYLINTVIKCYPEDIGAPDYDDKTKKRCLFKGVTKNYALTDSNSTILALSEKEATFILNTGYFEMYGSGYVDFDSIVFMGKLSSEKTNTAIRYKAPSRKIRINNCTFLNLKYGVCDDNDAYIWSGENFYTNNYFALCECGLYFKIGGYDCVVSNNIAQGTVDNLIISGSSLNLIYTQNHDYSKYGTSLYSGAVISNNYFDGVSKLTIATQYFGDSDNNKKASYGTTITGNTFFVQLRNEDESGWLIKVKNALAGATICNNNINGSFNDGNLVFIDVSECNVVANNYIHNNSGIGLNYLFSGLGSNFNYYENSISGLTNIDFQVNTTQYVYKNINFTDNGFIATLYIENPERNIEIAKIINVPENTSIFTHYQERLTDGTVIHGYNAVNTITTDDRADLKSIYAIVIGQFGTNMIKPLNFNK